MDLRSYQLAAHKTDCLPSQTILDLTIPLLGLAGEVGELQSEYKKAMRDGDGPELFRGRFSEELGDVLWYVANLATKLGFDLNKVAEDNLKKANERWGLRTGNCVPIRRFDEGYPEGERFPRHFCVTIRASQLSDDKYVAQAYIDELPLGHHLADNAYVQDGYRFHDIFHFAFATVLGWSPITRWLLNRKRRSRPKIDEVEDGARAKAAEEAISLFIFSQAKEYNWLEGKASVSSEMLRTVKRMVWGLEVTECTTGEWEEAIIQGFAAWRFIERHKGGHLAMDLETRKLIAQPLDPDSRTLE